MNGHFLPWIVKNTENMWPLFEPFLMPQDGTYWQNIDIAKYQKKWLDTWDRLAHSSKVQLLWPNIDIAKY